MKLILLCKFLMIIIPCCIQAMQHQKTITKPSFDNALYAPLDNACIEEQDLTLYNPHPGNGLANFYLATRNTKTIVSIFKNQKRIGSKTIENNSAEILFSPTHLHSYGIAGNYQNNKERFDYIWDLITLNTLNQSNNTAIRTITILEQSIQNSKNLCTQEKMVYLDLIKKHKKRLGITSTAITFQTSTPCNIL